MSRRVAAWVFVVGLAASGCGRYGPPVRPSQVPPPAATQSEPEPTEEAPEQEPPAAR